MYACELSRFLVSFQTRNRDLQADRSLAPTLEFEESHPANIS